MLVLDILVRHLQDYIIYNDKFLDGQPLDLDIGPLPFVISLQGGQEVTPFFMLQGIKIRMFVIHIILYRCRNTILYHIK